MKVSLKYWLFLLVFLLIYSFPLVINRSKLVRCYIYIKFCSTICVFVCYNRKLNFLLLFFMSIEDDKG